MVNLPVENSVAHLQPRSHEERFGDSSPQKIFVPSQIFLCPETFY